MRDAARVLAAAAIALIAGSAGPGATAADDVGTRLMSPISGDPDRPRRHFRLADSVDLSAADAAALYRIVRPALAIGYARSGLPTAQAYQGWQRVNTAPYLSQTHGNHYLNNYVNERAAAYSAHEDAGELPVGAVIAKDSFAVTETGGLLLGPLFVMEKMPEGFDHASGDWKYSLVQPGGRMFGETNGPGEERVEYCIACHLAREPFDHLYFVPEAVRR